MSNSSLASRAKWQLWRLAGRRLLVVVAILVLIGSLGLWCWSERPIDCRLTLGAGVELKYRKDLLDTLCTVAADQGLTIEEERAMNASDALAKVDAGELDATVIPAGLTTHGENIRQVAVFDCEPLHLFVRPELLAEGIGGLKGRRINLGPEGSGARSVATDVLEFSGMKPDVDYADDATSIKDLLNLPAVKLPDAIFTLSPLPSPLGEKLAHKYGYCLMELPFGAAMALRKPSIEDVCIPAQTYSVHPAVPAKQMHTIGTRSLLVANANSSKVAIRRLLEVFYESNFAHRVGLPPFDPNLIQRGGEYPLHAGSLAYLHRHDPWISKDLIDSYSSAKGLLVPLVSAVVLVWHWFRRRKSPGLGNFLKNCTQLELEVLDSIARGDFNQAEMEVCRAKLLALKCDLLKEHDAGLIPGDQAFETFLSRLDSLLRTLPTLVSADPSQPRASLHALLRQAG
jgi:TRAP-type uncharacterized transport system substrate-binding protein